MVAYKGYELETYTKITSFEGKPCTFRKFNLFKNGEFIFTDDSTIDGIPMQSEAQAMNEGKKNVDTLIRLNLT